MQPTSDHQPSPAISTTWISTVQPERYARLLSLLFAVQPEEQAHITSHDQP